MRPVFSVMIEFAVVWILVFGSTETALDWVSSPGFPKGSPYHDPCPHPLPPTPLHPHPQAGLVRARMPSPFSRVQLFATLCTVAPARLLCPWDSLGKTIGVSCHALLQGIFQTQGSNLPSLKSPALAGRFFTTSIT